MFSVTESLPKRKMFFLCNSKLGGSHVNQKLNTIDADALQSIPYAPLPFIVEDLLPQGLHLLAGAPKIGKS